MEKLFSVTLAGGRKTEVFLASPGEDLAVGSDFIVTDANAGQYLGSRTADVVLPPGEGSKNWDSIDRILSSALAMGLARDSLFVGLGGGVILDMTAFAASIYMRGARVSLVPTTLLSMVDATLGGKTGIDYGGGKNLVGTFFPAEAVIIAPWTLKTLSDAEYRSGLGEVLKHAVLSQDDRLFRFLEENRNGVMGRDDAILAEMIRLSLEVKISYIERDPEERKGIRSALNLGHTFSHALESYMDYGISHGEGVAWGTAAAIRTGARLGITPQDLASRTLALLSLYGFSSDAYRIPADDFASYSAAIGKDKKKSRGSVWFVLMEGQGRPVLIELPEDEIRKAVIG